MAQRSVMIRVGVGVLVLTAAGCGTARREQAYAPPTVPSTVASDGMGEVAMSRELAMLRRNGERREAAVRSVDRD
jgi:hypothetical protein